MFIPIESDGEIVALLNSTVSNHLFFRCSAPTEADESELVLDAAAGGVLVRGLTELRIVVGLVETEQDDEDEPDREDLPFE